MLLNAPTMETPSLLGEIDNTAHSVYPPTDMHAYTPHIHSTNTYTLYITHAYHRIFMHAKYISHTPIMTHPFPSNISFN